MSLKSELNLARKNNYAIGCFNICNLETFQAVVNACVKTDKPVFVAISNKSLDYIGLDNVVGFKNSLKKGIKAFFHLDHGSYENCLKCINAGFDSVKFDGSKLALKENIGFTKKVVKKAKAKKILVEGEVGSLDGINLTSVAESIKFVKETGIDLLAVSVGNVHGYADKIIIDYKRLEDISTSVKVPIVFHGSSGLENNVIKNVLKLGVCKINVDSDLRMSFTKSLKDYFMAHSINHFNKDSFDMRNYLSIARDSFEKKVIERILLFHP